MQAIQYRDYLGDSPSPGFSISANDMHSIGDLEEVSLMLHSLLTHKDVTKRENICYETLTQEF